MVSVDAGGYVASMIGGHRSSGANGKPECDTTENYWKMLKIKVKMDSRCERLFYVLAELYELLLCELLDYPRGDL